MVWFRDFKGSYVTPLTITCRQEKLRVINKKTQALFHNRESHFPFLGDFKALY